MAQLVSLGDFASDGERKAAEELKRLPGNWVILANKVLPRLNGDSYEIDFIVLADRHIFVIDEKSWIGPITGNEEYWFRNGRPEHSPLKKIDMVAKVLAGNLRSRIFDLDQVRDHFVEGIILLTRAEAPPVILGDPRVAQRVLLLREAVARLRQWDADPDAGNLQVGAQRERVREALSGWPARPKFPDTINRFRLEDRPVERHGVYRALATNEFGQRRLLTLFPLHDNDPDLRLFYQRQTDALVALRGTGLAPEMGDVSEWGDYLVAPSSVPEGAPLVSLSRPQSQAGARHELTRAAAAFRALSGLHERGMVHRSLGPETIYLIELGSDVRVMFNGFHAARLSDRTIAARLDGLGIEDAYAAPEIAIGGYGIATAASDVFSMALIFLERIAGAPPSRLRLPEGGVLLPPADEGWWGYLPQATVEALTDLLTAALSRGPLAPPDAPDAHRPSAAVVADTLEALARPPLPAPEPESERLLDGRYRVVRVLGEGSSARTLLVEDTVMPGQFAVKQYLRPAQISETGEARREFEALRQLNSPHLPRVFDVYRPQDDVHVKLEYIAGQSLRAALPGYRGDLDLCRRLADDLLEAVEQLERRGLLHRDIKPDNVMLRDDGDAVLIDFGSATPAGTLIGIDGATPLYLPPEALYADEPPPTVDRYALAAVLFQALTGRLPIADGGAQPPAQALDGLPDEQREFAAALLRAVSPHPGERHASSAELRAALFPPPPQPPVPPPTDLRPVLEERTNEWVDLVRGLYRNSVRGNADNRGLDSDFARQTYVPTALDTVLLDRILFDAPRAVFLSGNPGDGKTAFLEKVKDALLVLDAVERDDDVSGWVYELDGRTFRACYDASEARRGMSADEQLLDRLQGLEGDDPPRDDVTVLVAINDGRLVDVLDRQRGKFGWLAREAERARTPGAALEPGGVWVIDLKRRAYVRLRPNAEQPSVMRRVLAQLTAPKEWEDCGGCAAQDTCPILRNARRLGDAGDGAPAERLERLLLLAHLRGQRHTTMRDLRSALAYLITADVGCREVHVLRRRGDIPLETHYWEGAFTTPAGGDRSDILLGELQLLDPARFAQPHLERYLYFNQYPEDARLRAGLFNDGVDFPIPPLPGGDGDNAPTPESDTPRGWLSRMKRRLFFEARPPAELPPGVLKRDWPGLLPYRDADLFTAALAGETDPASLLPAVTRGIGRSDGLAGHVLEGNLSLKVAHSDKERLTVCKQFPLSQFTLDVERPPAGDVIEVTPQALTLRHQSGARLDIPLDLFELLCRMADGLEPGSPEFVPLLEDLAPFKNAVHRTNAIDLILIESGRRYHKLTQRDGKVILNP